MYSILFCSTLPLSALQKRKERKEIKEKSKTVKKKQPERLDSQILTVLRMDAIFEVHNHIQFFFW